jgi:ATP:corrinoid adenosyltransferase
MTYIETLKQNGASVTVSALEQRARRMARHYKLRLEKTRDNEVGYVLLDERNTVKDYRLPTIEEVVERLADKDYMAKLTVKA